MMLFERFIVQRIYFQRYISFKIQIFKTPSVFCNVTTLVLPVALVGFNSDYGRSAMFLDYEAAFLG